LARWAEAARRKKIADAVDNVEITGMSAESQINLLKSLIDNPETRDYMIGKAMKTGNYAVVGAVEKYLATGQLDLQFDVEKPQPTLENDNEVAEEVTNP
jgi:hypothetical protein